MSTENKAPAEAKQLGLFAAIASLSYVFWIVGGMEMIERLAYYGVKAVGALYAKDPVSKGGLGITMTQFGSILMIWALVQSILPVFTGVLSDRFGYKQTIGLSTIIKIAGYLIMAAMPTYVGFLIGAIVLAAGTAVFKPGIQGTLVKASKPENSSMAWGIFYQTVNIGGFLGPLLAGAMRKLEWKYVFLACAAIISLNFIMLLLYKEPGKAEREAELAKEKSAGTQTNMVMDSLNELKKPHLFIYLAIFSGFWFMFNALFDVLPVYIEEWVWTGDIIATLFGSGGSDNAVVNFFVVTNLYGTQIQPEGLLNFNALMIMTTCFLFAWVSGLMRPTTSMVLGTALATIALFAIGHSTAGWICLGSIAIFSAGEMFSSPKFSEFVGNFAPDSKKAMYLGFSQIPLAIGWTLEGWLGPKLYDIFASKENFSREMLEAEGMMTSAQVEALPNGEAFDTLVHTSVGDVPLDGLPGMTPADMSAFADAVVVEGSILPKGSEEIAADAVTRAVSSWDLHNAVAKDLAEIMDEDQANALLDQAGPHLEVLFNATANPLTESMYAANSVSMVWDIMGVIGIISAVLIFLYGRWVKGKTFN
jgi:MFS family permease